LAGRLTFFEAAPPEQLTLAGSPCTDGVLENVHHVACVTVTFRVTEPPLLGNVDRLTVNDVIDGRGTAAVDATAAGSPATRQVAAPAGTMILATTRARYRIIRHPALRSPSAHAREHIRAGHSPVPRHLN